METLENDDCEVLTVILPRVMEDLKRKSPTLEEEMEEVAEKMTRIIMDTTYKDIRGMTY